MSQTITTGALSSLSLGNCIDSPMRSPRLSGRPARFSRPQILRLLVLASIVAFLIFQLSKIGWVEVIAHLPQSPAFYALSIGFVLVPVAAEIVAFQTLSRLPVRRHWRVFLRKHVLNKAVMNLSGEAFFLQHLSRMNAAKSTAPLGLKQASVLLKDINLIRAFVANLWIVLLAIVTIVSGDFEILQNIAIASPALVVTVSVLTLGIVIGALVLFRKLTRLPIGLAADIASIYLLRSILMAAILMTQWSIAMPTPEFATWLVFLMLFSVSKKSPVGGELVFASVVISIPGLSGDGAAVAAMLISIAAVSQLFYLVCFLISGAGKAHIADGQGQVQT